MTRTMHIQGAAGRRLIAVGFVAAVVAATGVASAPSQAAAATIICENQHIQNQVLASSVVVPPGAQCVLTSVIVVGDVGVRESADLVFDGTTVLGGLTVAKNGFASGENASLVAGGVVINDAFAVMLADSTTAGGIRVLGAEFGIHSVDSHHVGNLASADGWTTIIGGTFNGGISTSGDAVTGLWGPTVSRAVTVKGGWSSVLICGTAINGDLAVNASSLHAIRIGDPGGVAGPDPCPGNVVFGSLDVHDNGALSVIEIAGNIIGRDLDCTGNSPAPTAGTPNVFFGTASGQCAALVGQGFGWPAKGSSADPGSERNLDPGRLAALEERRKAVDL